MPAIDMTGQKVGKWTVLHQVFSLQQGHARLGQFLCRCTCGKEQVITGLKLRSTLRRKGYNTTTMCVECAQREIVVAALKKQLRVLERRITHVKRHLKALGN
jgi:hypothetical protein